jgi:DNA polymerase elongation subunit (family B)
MKLKTLLFDIETSPNVSYNWHGLHEVEIIEIIEEGYILSFAFKWLGQKKVNAFCLNDFKGNWESKKKQLVLELHKLFNEADIIVAHNGNQFDIKMANRSFTFYGLTPPKPYKSVDTLTLARSKFKFNSNHLNDLGKFLGLGVKVETGGFKLWKACMNGDEKSFKKMVRYNKNDVVLLEKVYLRLRPYITTHPNVAISEGYVCPLCGSLNVVGQGYHYLAGGFIKRQWQCKDCGRWSCDSQKKRNENVEVGYLK